MSAGRENRGLYLGSWDVETGPGAVGGDLGILSPASVRPVPAEPGLGLGGCRRWQRFGFEVVQRDKPWSWRAGGVPSPVQWPVGVLPAQTPQPWPSAGGAAGRAAPSRTHPIGHLLTRSLRPATGSGDKGGHDPEQGLVFAPITPCPVPRGPSHGSLVLKCGFVVMGVV